MNHKLNSTLLALHYFNPHSLHTPKSISHINKAWNLLNYSLSRVTQLKRTNWYPVTIRPTPLLLCSWPPREACSSLRAPSILAVQYPSSQGIPKHPLTQADPKLNPISLATGTIRRETSWDQLCKSSDADQGTHLGNARSHHQVTRDTVDRTNPFCMQYLTVNVKPTARGCTPFALLILFELERTCPNGPGWPEFHCHETRCIIA